MRPDIIDTPYNASKFLDELHRLNVRTIIRYYNMINSSALPEKCLTRAEANVLAKEGFSLAVVFQQHGRNISNFNGEIGLTHAERALHLATEIEQPGESAIYFAVDHDFYRPNEVEQVSKYFSAITRAFEEAAAKGNTRYHVGAYASGKLCATLKSRGIAKYFWLPRALGWSGSREYYTSNSWHLFQNNIELRFGKLDYDTNIMNPTVRNFGSFVPGLHSSGSSTHANDEAGNVVSINAPSPDRQRKILENRRVIMARGGLTLRGGPGTQYTGLEILPYGKEVVILGERDGWCLVDLEGDNKADGFCYGAYLAPYGGY